MVPSKLKRHLETKHPFHVERNLAFFKRARDLNQRQQDRLLDCVKVSDKAMEASYMLAELIAKQKKPHTIAETLILPALKKRNCRCHAGSRCRKCLIKSAYVR